jgi:8-oxo-dGTP diphosphatase
MTSNPKKKTCPSDITSAIARAPLEVHTTEINKPWALSVRAIIRDDRGRILLLRRTLEARSFSRQWEPPGGGVDPGGKFDQAVIREVEEETGFTGRLERCVGVSEDEMPRIRIVNLFCEVAVTGGTMQLSTEHSEALWCPPDEIPTLDLARPVKDILLGLAQVGESESRTNPRPLLRNIDR